MSIWVVIPETIVKPKIVLSIGDNSLISAHLVPIFGHFLMSTVSRESMVKVGPGVLCPDVILIDAFYCVKIMKDGSFSPVVHGSVTLNMK